MSRTHSNDRLATRLGSELVSLCGAGFNPRKMSHRVGYSQRYILWRSAIEIERSTRSHHFVAAARSSVKTVVPLRNTVTVPVD